MHNICDLKKIHFPLYEGDQSFLCVYEANKKVPFPIERIFMIHSADQLKRGHHAHKECPQLLIVLKGVCKVTCDDGALKKEIILSKSSEGLLIPPSIWAEQEYDPDTILIVLTDKPYDESDYIRSYNDFLDFRK